MECCICGKYIEIPKKIEIEGSIVDVCDNCMKYGKIVKVTEIVSKPKKNLKTQPEIDEFQLVENYGMKIKVAREKLGLKRVDFAKRIAEKESVIKRVEEERMIPNEMLIRKIEKFLKIKLTSEKVNLGRKIKSKKKMSGKLTIGDIVEVV